MKKATILSIFLLIAYFLFTTHAQADIIIGFDPMSQQVRVGDPASVELFIDGLEAFGQPSLSTFDLDVIYDPTILDFPAVTFGDPLLGDQLDLFGLGSLTASDDSVPGRVNLFELSLELPFDLDTFQEGGFTLATLTFDTLAVGTSSLDISINSLGDAFGDPLFADVQSGSISAVPEPATILLIGSGLAGLVGLRKRFRRS